jgi:Flp pilus assembly protein TadB
LAQFGDDLTIVDLTPADVVSRVVVSACILSFALGAGVVALTSAGVLPSSPIWWLACLVIGAFAGWIALRDVAAKIERRRLEVRQMANDFIQLVAVGLTTDQSVEEAIRFALSVGSSQAFDELRREVQTAPQRGVAVWEAIGGFGDSYGVRELSEFATSVERQGLHGVSIADSVSTLAASMRSSALDRLERDADRANANLAGPTIGFVVTTIVFLAYPLAQRISEAFGK